MHIAICGDNIADRKQFERLLKREADKRRNDVDAIYIDSFGNTASLLSAPMLYNVFFIDYQSEGKTSDDIAAALREQSVTAPIYICSSATGSIEEYDLPKHYPQIYLIRKPILPELLSQTIDNALAIMTTHHAPLEFRGVKNTIYMQEDELAYLKRNKHEFEIHRMDGDIDYVTSSYQEASHSLENNSLFIIAKEYILNSSQIDHVSFFRVYMKNGDTLFVPPFTASLIKKIMIELREDGVIR